MLSFSIRHVSQEYDGPILEQPSNDKEPVQSLKEGGMGHALEATGKSGNGQEVNQNVARAM